MLTVSDNNHGTITRTYDALNRVTSYTDTYGKTIRYTYDAVGNLITLTYPDNTAVTYAYDANNNLTSVTDWANRVTTYTYDANNRVIGVTKPDGSVTTTVYDDMQRVTSTVDRTASGAIISGFEYTYDNLSRIIEEKVLANSTKMCYTYDELSRVTKRTVKSLSGVVYSEETFAYDAAGNMTGDQFGYDANNRLVSYNGNNVSYDSDGNMTFNGAMSCMYDSSNRLTYAGGFNYSYNAEDVRILAENYLGTTTYTYDTNSRLSKLLTKTTNGTTTKYVYGLGLIGEEINSSFKTYHFDYRGSTVAITDASGNITDKYVYDTYGKVIERIGSSQIIFGYNGRDGVVTDGNGLIYMRARYYSPDMRRFINADVVAGDISDSTSLNRYSYVNGDPVSYIDPFGLCRENEVESNSILGSFIKNLWSELDYPGQIHNEVVRYLSAKHNLIAEHPSEDKRHRYDLYSIDGPSYWEVKPISYLFSPPRMIKMAIQMKGYDDDGVNRGFPLGTDQFPYKDYTVEVYSDAPGEVYYSFKKNKSPKTSSASAPVPKKTEEKDNQFSINWTEVGETVTTVVEVGVGIGLVILGIYYLVTTGDTSVMEQGLRSAGAY